MVDSLLFRLPTEMQERVANFVAMNSIADLFNLRATCKTLKEVTERSSVFSSANLYSIPWRRWCYCGPFVDTCYKHGNLHMIFWTGAQDCIRYERIEDGLETLKIAADGGYVPALYAYAMIQMVFCDDASYLRRFTRESITAISKPLRAVSTGREITLPAFIEKREAFKQFVVPSLYACTCTPRNNWFYWCSDGFKVADMCDECFWATEVGLFLFNYPIRYVNVL